MTTKKTPVRAVIVRKGRCEEDGYTEPYARLLEGPHAGRVMPMGWNLSGPIFPVGCEGAAVYVATPSAGLYQFTPTTIARWRSDREEVTLLPDGSVTQSFRGGEPEVVSQFGSRFTASATYADMIRILDETLGSRTTRVLLEEVTA